MGIFLAISPNQSLVYVFVKIQVLGKVNSLPRSPEKEVLDKARFSSVIDLYVNYKTFSE